jgi:hypothetical protein
VKTRFYNFALIFKSIDPDVLLRVEDVLKEMGCRVIYKNGPTTRLLFVVTSETGKSPQEINLESRGY